MAILTVNTFKSMFGLDIDDTTVLNAITIANKDLYKLLRSQQEFITQDVLDNQTIHFGNEFPITTDLELDLTVDDIEIFEYETVDNTRVELADKVTSVSGVDIPSDYVVKLQFSEELPHDGYQLAIRVNKAKINCYDPVHIDSIRRYLALSAFNTMSKDILLHMRQRGISSFNINGVSVDVTTADFAELKKNNEAEMLDIYNRFMPLDIRRTRTNNQWLGYRNGRLRR